jgi:imidazole glycerol-phosphate synthase subunit HisH
VIAVVDYGLGNLASVRNAFRYVGADAIVTADPDEINRADGIVLPGVGAASAGMQRIRGRGLEQVIRRVARSGTPVLGLCLGMQLLFDRSEEGDTSCLGLIPGTVRRIEGGVKVPHIGWNEVVRRDGSPMFRGISGRPYFYFVHSYVCIPADEQVISGVTEYAGSFCSAVVSMMVWGTQFHPERSGDTGLQLIRNFAALCLGQLEEAPVSCRENS